MNHHHCLCIAFTLDNPERLWHSSRMLQLAVSFQRPSAASIAHPRPVEERTLHVIDIENLIGSTSFTVGEAAVVARRYALVSGCGPQDFTVLASSHIAAKAAWFGWPTGRRLVRSGPDGADRALIDVLTAEDVHARFGRVVVASGDGIFSGPCAWLQEMGCSMTVVTRRNALSRRLAFAVRDIRFLETQPGSTPTVRVFGRVA